MKSKLATFSTRLIFASLSLAPMIAQADRVADLEAMLAEFDADPAAVMGRLPKKTNALTGEVIQPKSVFSAEEIANGRFIEAKDQKRASLCTTVKGARVCLGGVLPGKAPFEDNDLAKNLVDNGARLVKKLSVMEREDLTQAKLKESPWSDTYWPIYMGQLATRYADEAFPNSSSWKKNFDYSEKNDLSSLLRDASSVDDLSPAEKYDLLVGDEKGSLTASNWGAGQGYYDDTHKVETWMGLCHGWAPASYMVPRPKRMVTMTAADGRTKINFYPSDIKGLASLLWAKNNGDVRFIGGRCNDKRPATDRNGRVTSDECFDTNPGTWHLAVVNQIGVSKRSFVLDATYDYEVWNQPVYAYEYSYFNPQTGKATGTLSKAKVAIEDFTKDKFKKYRSDDAVSVVGISMAMTYIQETEPSHERTDSPRKDAPTTVHYVYDVELNAKGEIVGGEWYSRLHPDFLWTPAPDDEIETSGDARARGAWSGKGAMPESWQRAAAATAKADGSPLSKIVKVLAKRAHRGPLSRALDE